ncbi:MAG: (d)CMP kinase [Deltaproteobacteria bacterium]|nr:(d)CMP kinase [Deltaproteobacteria bacterium]
MGAGLGVPRCGHAGGAPLPRRRAGLLSVVAIVGPTASGKSAVAERLAELCEAVIISVDSMQVYRGMDVGTAKPSASVRARIPHRMIDIVDPSE